MSEQPAETGEPRRCGNCLHRLRIDTWHRNPPTYHTETETICATRRSPMWLENVDDDDTCDAWQQRGAE